MRFAYYRVYSTRSGPVALAGFDTPSAAWIDSTGALLAWAGMATCPSAALRAM